MEFTRKDYIEGRITHHAYYSRIAQEAGISYEGSYHIDKCRKALENRDYYLNTIPLRLWDNYAYMTKASIDKALRNHGDWYAPAMGVCTHKAAALLVTFPLFENYNFIPVGIAYRLPLAGKSNEKIFSLGEVQITGATVKTIIGNDEEDLTFHQFYSIFKPNPNFDFIFNLRTVEKNEIWEIAFASFRTAQFIDVTMSGLIDGKSLRFSLREFARNNTISNLEV